MKKIFVFTSLYLCGKCSQRSDPIFFRSRILLSVQWYKDRKNRLQLLLWSFSEFRLVVFFRNFSIKQLRNEKFTLYNFVFFVWKTWSWSILLLQINSQRIREHAVKRTEQKHAFWESVKFFYEAEKKVNFFSKILNCFCI